MSSNEKQEFVPPKPRQSQGGAASTASSPQNTLSTLNDTLNKLRCQNVEDIKFSPCPHIRLFEQESNYIDFDTISGILIVLAENSLQYKQTIAPGTLLVHTNSQGNNLFVVRKDLTKHPEKLRKKLDKIIQLQDKTEKEGLPKPKGQIDEGAASTAMPEYWMNLEPTKKKFMDDFLDFVVKRKMHHVFFVYRCKVDNVPFSFPYPRPPYITSDLKVLSTLSLEFNKDRRRRRAVPQNIQHKDATEVEHDQEKKWMFVDCCMNSENGKIKLAPQRKFLDLTQLEEITLAKIVRYDCLTLTVPDTVSESVDNEMLSLFKGQLRTYSEQPPTNIFEAKYQEYNAFGLEEKYINSSAGITQSWKATNIVFVSHDVQLLLHAMDIAEEYGRGNDFNPYGKKAYIVYHSKSDSNFTLTEKLYRALEKYATRSNNWEFFILRSNEIKLGREPQNPNEKRIINLLQNQKTFIDDIPKREQRTSRQNYLELLYRKEKILEKTEQLENDKEGKLGDLRKKIESLNDTLTILKSVDKELPENSPKYTKQDYEDQYLKGRLQRLMFKNRKEEIKKLQSELDADQQQIEADLTKLNSELEDVNTAIQEIDIITKVPLGKFTASAKEFGNPGICSIFDDKYSTQEAAYCIVDFD